MEKKREAPKQWRKQTNVGEGWRERLAEKCLARARKNRQEAFRMSRHPGALASSLSSSLSSLVQDELHHHVRENTASSADDDDVCTMTQEEYEDLLLYLENAIIVEEEQERARLLQTEYEENEKYEASLFDPNASLVDSPERVVCPLCQSAFLSLHSGLLFCSCGLRMNLQMDGISLSYIRDRIHDVLADHGKDCPFDIPKFSSLHHFGTAHLCFICPLCGATEVIV